MYTTYYTDFSRIRVALIFRSTTPELERERCPQSHGMRVQLSRLRAVRNLKVLCRQVCSLWRDVLYASPRFWTGLTMVARCRELRAATPESRRRFYNSVHVRGMDTVALNGAATDDDVLELVRHLSAPAARRVHSLSLRCCAVSDRGLESLLAHMQVGIILIILFY